jgi:WD40 repeat protein
MEQTRDTVFISYSHNDKSWLRRLLICLSPYIRLDRLNVWADPYIKVGGRWHREIDDALEKTKIGVLLMTPDFLDSDFIMSEEVPRLLELEAAGKLTLVLIPISASSYQPTGLGDFQWIYPPSTPLDGLRRQKRNKAFVNIVNELVEIADSGVAQKLEREPDRPVTSEVVRTVKPKRGTSLGLLYGVEPQRPNYQPRPEELNRIVQSLLDTESASVGIADNSHKIGVHGMGGIGKTVLAIATANEEEIRRNFQDGVYWVSLGQHPDIPRIQTQLAKELGLENTEAEDSLSGLIALQKGFRSKNVLLILDDVWQIEHAKHFDALSPESRTLITTRDDEILTALGAHTVSLGVLTESQALTLLAEWSAQAQTSLPEISKTIASSCGYIPLALSLAGAQVQDGSSWEDVLEALQDGDLEFLDHPYGSVFKTLSLSVFALSHEEAARYLELAIFPEDTKVPLATVCRYLNFTSDLKDRECRKLIRHFQHKGLLYLDEDASTIGFHDLQRDFLRLSSDDLETLNNQFLNAFRVLLPESSAWHALPKDEPYLWSYLTYHLWEAGQMDELQQLLFSYDWLQNKLINTNTNSLITDFQYLTDVDETRLLRDALRISSHVLVKNPKQLPSQLTGRLNENLSERFRHLLEEVKAKGDRPWLRLRFPSLEQPGGQLIRKFEGHTGSVTSVAVTPDGQCAISASRDSTLKVWNLDTGEIIQTLNGHESFVKGILMPGSCQQNVTSVAVTPDGQRIISASSDSSRSPSDGTLKIWDLSTGETLNTLHGHETGVTKVVVTPDGQHAVSASYDRTLKVWDLATGKTLQTLHGHEGPVTGVAITPDGQRAVSTSFDKTLKVWDLATGEALKTLHGHTQKVVGVAVTPDGQHAVSASYDCTLKFWDLATGKTLQTLHGHEGQVTGVAVTPDGQRAVSTSFDKTLKVWDLVSGKHLQTLRGHDSLVAEVVLTPDGKRAVSASYDHDLRAWELSTVATIQIRPRHRKWVCGAAVTPDGRYTVSASADKTLKVWDLATGETLQTLHGHTSGVFGVAIHPDGQHAVSASHDKTLKVWDLATGETLQTLRGHTENVWGVAIYPDGRYTVSASSDKTLKVWDLTTGENLQTLHGHTDAVFGVAITPDGRHAVSASHDKTLKVWDLATGETLQTLHGHEGPVTSVAVTPAGKRAVSSSYDRTVRIWDFATGELIKTLHGHDNLVWQVAVTPDGKRAVSASADKTLRVWNLDTGELITSITVDASVRSCSVAPDGVTIVAWDGLCRMHILGFEE